MDADRARRVADKSLVVNIIPNPQTNYPGYGVQFRGKGHTRANGEQWVYDWRTSWAESNDVRDAFVAQLEQLISGWEVIKGGKG